MTQGDEEQVSDVMSLWQAHADAELVGPAPADWSSRAVRDGTSRYRWRTARSTFVAALIIAILGSGALGWWMLTAQRQLESSFAERALGAES